MNLAEKLVEDFEQLSEEKKREVIHFVEFLKIKDKKEKLKSMDLVIDENKEALQELAK